MKHIVKIDTFHVADPDEVETSRLISHDDDIHRRWLEKHIFWAVRNGRGVEITPVGE
jgi:hypothetical protein